MRVLLIAPPWLDIYGNYRAAAKLGCVAPPLGFAYLGGAVEAIGSECRIVDMEMEGLDAKGLMTTIREYNPDLIGITATTPVFKNAAILAGMIKKNFPDIALGIGGVHSTVIGKAILEECEYFDFQVVGEGEFTMQETIKAIEAGAGSLEGIKGIIFRKNGKVIENPRRSFIQDLDSIPMPARNLFKTDLYRHTVPGKKSVVYASVFTSRGCPFQCLFCSQHTMYGRHVRWHGIERVIAELKQITQDFGVRHIIFMDETLTLDKARLRGICQAIKDADLKFTWEGWTHASTIDEDIIGVMKDAGLIRLSFGIESGDPEILKGIKKGVTLGQIKNAYKLAFHAGIETRGSAMLGHPNETRETAWQTIKFCRNIKECQQLFLNIACPYPGTELYEYARSGKGGMKLLSTDYSKYTRYGDPVISVNNLSPKDLKRLQTIGLVYFYLTPKRIWHNVIRRAGFRAGLVNVLAFLKGVLSSLFGGKKIRAGQKAASVETEEWDAFWEKRKEKLLGRLLVWFRRRFVTTTLAHYIQRNTHKGTLIEAGCGSGETTLQVASRRGDRVVLVDKSPQALALAKRLARQYGIDVRFVECDIAELSAHIRPARENIAYNIGVIEHFRDPSSILCEMARVSGHYAIAVIPERSMFWLVFIQISRLLRLVPPDFFIRFFDQKQLSSLIIDAGLKVQWVRRVRIFGLISYLGVCYTPAGTEERKSPLSKV